MHIYYEGDADINLIKSKRLLLVGYGNQGRAHALNLKDSGVQNIIVALPKGSETIKKAESDGFQVLPLEEAVVDSDFIMMAAPDEMQADIYNEHIKGKIKQGAAIAFIHGLSVHFGLIEPEKDIDVILIAPKGPGHALRKKYLEGSGLPCLIAVYNDYSDNAQALALSYAAAIGGGRAGILRTTFQEECETDLFGEQAVLCGGMVDIIKAGFDTLVEAGYAPEMAYFECVHETKLIVDLIYERGIANMYEAISNTAEWGAYVTGERLVNQKTKEEMRNVLKDIQTGKFTTEWIQEYKAGAAKLKSIRRISREKSLEKVGEKLRNLTK